MKKEGAGQQVRGLAFGCRRGRGCAVGLRGCLLNGLMSRAGKVFAEPISRFSSLRIFLPPLPPPSRSGSVVLVYHSLPFGAATKPARSFSAQFFLRSGFSRVSGVVSDHCQMVNWNASLLGVKLQFLSNGNLVLRLCHLCKPPLHKACHSSALTFVLVLGVIHSSIHLSRPCSGSDIMAGTAEIPERKRHRPCPQVLIV